MLHVLRVVHMQQKRLCTSLEGEDEVSEQEGAEEALADNGDQEEDEETEEDEEDKRVHGKKHAGGTLKKPKRQEGHSDEAL